MATKSRAAMEELVQRVQSALYLSTKKEAECLLDMFISCVEDTLIEHLGEDGFYIKLNGLGKFSVHHRPAIWRKIGFSGETTRTKPTRKIRFVSLGKLRRLERAEERNGFIRGNRITRGSNNN